LIHPGNSNAYRIKILNISIAGMVFANPYIVAKLYAIAIGKHLFWNYFQRIGIWVAVKRKSIRPSDGRTNYRLIGFLKGVISGRYLSFRL